MYVSSTVLATRKWHMPCVSHLFHTAVLPVLAMCLLYHLDVD